MSNNLKLCNLKVSNARLTCSLCLFDICSNRLEFSLPYNNYSENWTYSSCFKNINKWCHGSTEGYRYLFCYCETAHKKKKGGSGHFAAHGLHVGHGVGCPWEIWLIRLSNTSTHENIIYMYQYMTINKNISKKIQLQHNKAIPLSLLPYRCVVLHINVLFWGPGDFPVSYSNRYTSWRSFRKFYGGYGELIQLYEVTLSFHQFHDFDTELDLHRITSMACQQGTLTLPVFTNLRYLFSTFHLEYPRYFLDFASIYNYDFIENMT